MPATDPLIETLLAKPVQTGHEIVRPEQLGIPLERALQFLGSLYHQVKGSGGITGFQFDHIGAPASAR